MPTPPSPMASPGASPFGSTSARRPGQARRKPPGADAVEHGHGRDIERQLQRLADRDGALEAEIEIFRRIGAVAHRPILDQRLRMDEAVLEAEPIDERLQRRSRRAQRLRHVDLAGVPVIEIVGGADPASTSPEE